MDNNNNFIPDEPVAPVQPQYEQPQYEQPQYEQPEQPYYQQPQYPQYQQPEQPYYQQPVQPYYQQPMYPQYQQQTSVMDTTGYPSPAFILTAGIVGLACGATFGMWLSCFYFIGYFFSIPGLVFSILGLVKAKAYANAGTTIPNKVRVGKGLSIAGLVTNIVAIALPWIIILFTFLIVLISGAASGSYSSY